MRCRPGDCRDLAHAVLCPREDEPVDPISWWERSFVHVIQRWTVDLAVDLYRWMRR